MTYYDLFATMLGELESNDGEPTDLFFECQEEIIANGTPRQVFDLITCGKQAGFKGLDYKRLADVIINSKSPIYNYFMARDIKGADIKAHEKAELESENAKWNFYFAHDIKGADVKAHWKVVKASGNQKYIDLFRRTFKIKDKGLADNNNV